MNNIPFYLYMGSKYIYRVIITRYKLPWFSPSESLKILLTPYERAHPWRLCLTPGLALAQALYVAYFHFAIRAVNSRLIRSSMEKDTIWTSYLYLFALLSAALLSPLEVLSSRLSVQRNHANEDGIQETASTGAAPKPEDQEELPVERVILLRDECRSPYKSLWHAARTVRHKESRYYLSHIHEHLSTVVLVHNSSELFSCLIRQTLLSDSGEISMWHTWSMSKYNSCDILLIWLCNESLYKHGIFRAQSEAFSCSSTR